MGPSQASELHSVAHIVLKTRKVENWESHWFFLHSVKEPLRLSNTNVRGPERLLCEIVKVKPRLWLRTQDSGDVKTMRHVSRRDEYREWNRPREKGIASKKVGRAEASKPFETYGPDTRCGARKFCICSAGFQSGFPPLNFHFGREIYILSHFIRYIILCFKIGNRS